MNTEFLFKDKYCPEVFYPKIQVADTMDLEGRIITLDFRKFYLTQVYTPNAGDNLKRLKERQVWDRKYADNEIGVRVQKFLYLSHNQI